MRIRSYIFAVGVALLMAVEAQASRYVGFESDAFNRAFPASYKRNIVFSPASYELDCVVFAEALDSDRKAKVAEQMGVATDFDSVYQPIIAEYNERTNEFWAISARGWVVPKKTKTPPKYRLLLGEKYNAAVCRAFPKKGAESWFRTQMEGEMENFEISKEVSCDSNRYSYYDLIKVHTEFETALPISVKDKFQTMEGEPVEVEYMRGVQKADVWEAKRFTLVRLPMKGGCSFYAMMPNEGVELGDIRIEISSKRIDNLMATIRSVINLEVVHSKVEVMLPKLKYFSRLELSGIMRYFKFPMNEITDAVGDAQARELVQYVKFELDGNGGEGSQAAGSALSAEKKIVFNRPFMFFIHQSSTATIPVAGQFTGRD